MAIIILIFAALGAHLTFTLVHEPSLLLPVMAAKLSAGISAILIGLIISKKITASFQP